MKGRPISEAPRDGTEIIAEVCNHYGIPATGHYESRRVSFRDRSWKPIGQDNHYMGDGSFIQWWPADTPEAELEKTERTNWNFRPSNGTNGETFQSDWCDRCLLERPAREDYEETLRNGGGCAILLRTMAFDIGDENYPTEWTYDRKTGEPKCTAFIRDVGQAVVEPRCDKTLEMFPEAKS